MYQQNPCEVKAIRLDFPPPAWETADVPLALLFPRYDHPAIEERYASWSSRTRLARAASATYVYDPERPISEAAEMVTEDLCLVVTDPMIVTADSLAGLLEGALQATGARAAVPVTNEAGDPRQLTAPSEAYLTMRQFERAADIAAESGAAASVIGWHRHDPGLYLASTDFLLDLHQPAVHALDCADVALVGSAYVHRWSPMRSQERMDLVSRIPESARSILELGCAEGLLGGAVKSRQKCRYVGIELDRKAALIAQRRLDDVYSGDVDEIVNILDERFEWIVAGDVLEHLADPWSTLSALRRVSLPGGSLVLSVPNASNWSMIADLVHGRLDYSYIGLACAGHLRFFTRQTIRDTLEIAGWEVVTIEPQVAIVTAETEALLEVLRRGGLAAADEDLLPTGFYVTARNPIPSD